MPYPPVPSRRMGWDADGTLVVGVSANGISSQSDGVPLPRAYSAFSSVNRQRINDENPLSEIVVGSGAGTRCAVTMALIFPELREIDGYFWNGANGGNFDQFWLYRSANTTNGRDGSWSALGTQVRYTGTVLDRYRTHIESSAVSNQRSVAFLTAGGGVGGSATARRFHVYGEISPGETPDRLLFMDESTGLEFDGPWDSGDTPRGSAREFQFRLKNNSTTAGNNVTLNGLQFTAGSLFLNAHAWYLFSIGGDAFSGTRQISSIAPEASSALITARQTIPQDEVLAAHAARIEATTGSVS